MLTHGDSQSGKFKPPKGAKSGLAKHRFDEALRAYHKTPLIVGVDEVGRGPLAGPVVAAAVILPAEHNPLLDGVKDSKITTPKQRQKLFEAIRAGAQKVAFGWALPEEIDRVNILQATFIAMKRAIARLELAPEGVLVAVDGNQNIPDLPYPQKGLINGDEYSLSIAAASIVAKVVRDRWMEELDAQFPGYGLAAHKGYATAEHLKALNDLGPCPIHRRSFAPVLQRPLPIFS